MIDSLRKDLCPQVPELRRLLDDELGPAESSPIEKHLEGCQHCQSLLDLFTTDNSLNPVGPPRQPMRFHPGEVFLEELRQVASEIIHPSLPSVLPVVEGYEVLRELGRGGMGVVYLARENRLNRLVALKLVHATAGQSVRERFRREAEAAARLQHPRIVSIYEIGETGGWPFLVLEFVDGPSLAQSLRGVTQDPLKSASIIEQLAKAMHVAHRAGVLHRDLKPANILIAPDGTPKVTDFGLAKLIDGDFEGSTRSGQLLGTPNYTAPEQIAGFAAVAKVGPETDVYGLGAILYELLTGRPPFQGSTPLDTLFQVLHRDPISPSRLQPKVPRDLETICLTCLQKSAAKRYSSADELAEDLRRFIDGRPVRARPVNWFGRTVRWSKRNPAGAALIAVSVLALATTLIGLGWLWREAERRLNIEAKASQSAHRRAADLSVDRYLTMCEKGEIARGIIGLAEIAEELSATDSDLLWAVRTNLDAWNDFLIPLRGELIHDSEIREIRFSSDGNYLVSADSRGTVRVWDAQSNFSKHAEFQTSTGVNALAISPDSRLLAVNGEEGSRVWELATGQSYRMETIGEGRVTSLTFDAQGKNLIAATATGSTRLWAVESGKPQGPEIHSLKKVERVALAPNTQDLMTGAEDGIVRSWNPNTGESIAVLSQHKGPVRYLLRSPDGIGFASASTRDLTVALPPLKPGNNYRPLHLVQPVTALAYDPAGEYIGCGSGPNEEGKGIVVYRVQGQPTVARNIPMEGIVRALAITRGATGILAGGDHWRASLWLDPYERLMTLRLDHSGPVTAVSINPKGNWMATVSRHSKSKADNRHSVFIWDAPKVLGAQELLTAQAAVRLEAGADGSLLAVDDKRVSIWDLF